MKRHSWLVATLFTVFLTVFVLAHAGRLGLNRSGRTSPRRVELRGNTQAYDPFLTDAAYNWRQGRANHWRGYLIQQQ